MGDSSIKRRRHPQTFEERHLEPAAAELRGGQFTLTELAAISAAISLKRIADAQAK